MWFRSQWWVSQWWAAEWWGAAAVPPVADDYGTGNVKRWQHINRIIQDDEELVALLTA